MTSDCHHPQLSPLAPMADRVIQKFKTTGVDKVESQPPSHPWWKILNGSPRHGFPLGFGKRCLRKIPYPHMPWGQGKGEERVVKSALYKRHLAWEIRRTKHFLSIFAIVALGTWVLCGHQIHLPDMLLTADLSFLQSSS